MSQEPFDFSSTAERFRTVSRVCIEENKNRRRHIYRLHIHNRKRCRFYSSDLVWTGSASFSQCFIHENTDSYRHGSYVCHLLFVGIKSFMELKTLSNAADREEKQFEEICHWFLDTYTAETINADAGISDDSDEQNYFSAL